VLSPDGDSIHTVDIERKRVISSRTAETFREILRSVTEEDGTGTTAAIEGNDVAGKTGTAQMINPETKHYSKEKYISSFVGFVPAHDPRLAMIVVIYEPKGQIYGGVVAAPVFREIATQALSYIGVPRQDMLQYHAVFTSR
jgi:cell division protein FtsI (penicillin-binding protein 3)